MANGGLGALDAESLLPEVLRGEEALECFGGVETIEDVVLLVAADRYGDAFDLALDPVLLGRILDVHVVDADGAAIRVAQELEDVFEAHAALLAEVRMRAARDRGSGTRVGDPRS